MSGTVQGILTVTSLDDALAEAVADLELAKGDVGLGNVDNTSDANKPVSTAQQAALDTKVASTTINQIVTLTQTAYDALTPASDTLYVITGA